MAEKGGATLWMLFRLERYQLDTQIKKDKKKFGNKKYFIYLCKTKLKCGFGVMVSTTLMRGKEWFDSIGLRNETER